MFTSLFPFQHKVLANHDTLKEGVPTIYSIFKEAGVPSVGFSATRFMDRKVGFPAIPPEQDVPQAAINSQAWFRFGGAQVDRVINWLDNYLKADEFFIWLHFYDVHAWGQEKRFSVPDSFFEKMQPADPEAHLQYLVAEHAYPVEFHGSKENLVKAVASYDARLNFVDTQIARLVEHLKKKKLWDDTLVVITSDHGEGLGNHNYAGHGMHIYQEQLLVPLIFYQAGKTKTQRFPEQVRTVDILPTIAEIYNLKPPAGQIPWQGASLKPIIFENSNAKLPLMSFAQRRPRDDTKLRRNWEDGKFYAVQDREWKLISRSDGKHELYNLLEDRFELKNLYDQERDVFQHHQEVLEKILKLPGVDADPGSLKDLNESELEELRSLGYL